ncbi:Uncharacterized protein SCF082_LOCUS53399 [Durusdinium trenchii]|uniref:Transmembrane protein n=1 Tax=Durusdinium trenchii TaxID=1381693 RepID=A0ABP0ST67_9DINO
MALGRRATGRGLLLLTLCACTFVSFQTRAFTQLEVHETDFIGLIAEHALLVSFLLMALCGAVTCAERSESPKADPAEKRPDYNSFLTISNILCFASGFVNALTIIDMGMTVSHMSGNTSHTGRLIMHGGAKFLHLMLAFCVGSFFAGFSKADTEAVYAGRFSPNMLGSALAVVFGCFIHYCKGQNGAANDASSEALLLFAFSQGIQNGVTRRCTSVPICTTHFTGYLTDVGTGVGVWARAKVAGEAPPTLLKVLIFASGIFFFGLGGVAAKETHSSYGMQAALIPAAIMAAVAGGFIPVVNHVKPRKSKK